MSCDVVVCHPGRGRHSEAEWMCIQYGNQKLGASPNPASNALLGASPRLGAHPTSHEGAYRVHGSAGQLRNVNCDRRSQCPLWGWTDDGQWVKVCVNEGEHTFGKYVYPNPMSCYTVTCEPGYSSYSEAEWQCDNGNNKKPILGAAALPSTDR